MGKDSDLFNTLSGGRGFMPGVAIDGIMYAESIQIIMMLEQQYQAAGEKHDEVMHWLNWDLIGNHRVHGVCKHWGWAAIWGDHKNFKYYGYGKHDLDWEQMYAASIHAFFSAIEKQTADGRTFILGGDEMTAVDAALGIWVQSVMQLTKLPINTLYPKAYAWDQAFMAYNRPLMTVGDQNTDWYTTNTWWGYGANLYNEAMRDQGWLAGNSQWWSAANPYMISKCDVDLDCFGSMVCEGGVDPGFSRLHYSQNPYEAYDPTKPDGGDNEEHGRRKLFGSTIDEEPVGTCVKGSPPLDNNYMTASATGEYALGTHYDWYYGDVYAGDPATSALMYTFVADFAAALGAATAGDATALLGLMSGSFASYNIKGVSSMSTAAEVQAHYENTGAGVATVVDFQIPVDLTRAAAVITLDGTTAGYEIRTDGTQKIVSVEVIGYGANTIDSKYTAALALANRVILGVIKSVQEGEVTKVWSTVAPGSSFTSFNDPVGAGAWADGILYDAMPRHPLHLNANVHSKGVYIAGDYSSIVVHMDLTGAFGTTSIIVIDIGMFEDSCTACSVDTDCPVGTCVHSSSRRRLRFGVTDEGCCQGSLGVEW